MQRGLISIPSPRIGEKVAKGRMRGGRLTTFIAVLLLATLPLLAADPPSAVGPLMKLYQSGRLPAERQPAVVEMICNRGNEHDLRVVFDKVLQPEGMAAPLRLKTMGWLTEAARTRKVKPAGELKGLADLVGSKEASVRLAAMKLAAILKVESVAPVLRSIATDPQATADLQQAAIAGLSALGGDENRATLKDLATKASNPAARVQAVAAVAAFDVPLAAKEAADILAKSSGEVPGPLLDAFLDRKDGSDALAEALKAQKLSVDAAKQCLRYVYSAGRNDAALSNVLSAAAGVAADPPPPSQDEVAAIAKEVLEKGDPARGEKIFRRADMNCMKCHSLSRAGAQVGPELSAVGGSSPTDYIVNSILNPSLAVKEQFVTRNFETSDGKVLTGIVIDRDESRVRIRDAQAKVIIIPTADIEFEVEGKSMMPNGLTKFLTKAELLDLIRFVSELGKPGPYAVRTVPTIQRWKLLIQPSEDLITSVPHLEHIRQSVLDTPPEAWVSVYGKVGGVLPLDELRKGTQPRVVILSGEVQVSEAGKMAVKIDSTEPLQTWVDAESFDTRRAFEVSLQPGLHRLTFRVEIGDKPSPELKVELTRPAESPAQFEVVGGQ